MPQCEMCGADEASLTTTKVEGAELELCALVYGLRYRGPRRVHRLRRQQVLHEFE